MVLKLNLDRLVMQSVFGEVSSPVYRQHYSISHEGEALILPSVGAICYNLKIGDSVFGWEGDHLEPGVSTRNKEEKDRDSAENRGYNLLSCIGNEARVVSGLAKGVKGVVTGIHGGIEHVMIDFDNQTLDKLIIGDKILIKAFGTGLKIINQGEIKFFNLDPQLLAKISPKLDSGNRLEVPVVGVIPPELMGSGLGERSAATGDYDLTTADQSRIKELGLASLRFGDLVAIKDTDNSFGRCFRRGAITIGVVVHSDCVLAGHGPGISTIITSRNGKIKPIIDPQANIGYYLKIGRWKKGGK
jgi:hypothetical protein